MSLFITPNDEQPRRPTIYDVAKHAGVSHQTVSRYVHNYEGIKPSTRERVAKAISELGYYPSFAARTLRTMRPRRIGVLADALLQYGPARLVHGASLAAAEKHYALDIISVSPGTANSYSEALQQVDFRELAGLMIVAFSSTALEALEAVHPRVPVYVRTEAEEGIDDEGNIRVLLDHLTGLGHRNFFHIPGPSGWTAAERRAGALREAVRIRGCRLIEAEPGDWTSDQGYRAVQTLPDGTGVTAVIAANDHIALGAIHALNDRGCEVPRDMSVTGIDDIPDAAHFRPALTTVPIDFESLGRNAMNVLIGHLTGTPPETLDLPAPALRARASTGPAPGLS